MKLFLIDAYALIYRSYYAFIKNPRINSKGMNTSAIFGFINSLEDVLKRENPTHIAVGFDPKGPTFRHEAYDQYKAQRQETPEDIRKSVPFIKDIIEAYNIPILEVPRYEADDVIGTVAKQAEKEGFEVYMMTPDKDYGQLVSEHIFMYRPRFGGDYEIMGVPEVLGKYGLTSVNQVIDLLGLMGDSADNIPGCPGVGEKTAQKLLAEFGTIENLLENTDKLKGSLQKKVTENKEQIRFSKFLATIKTDVPIRFDAAKCIREKMNEERLVEIYTELEFRTFINKIGGEPEKAKTKFKATPEPTKTSTRKKAVPTGPVQGSLFEEFAAEPTDVPKYSTLADLRSTPHTYHLIDTEEKRIELGRFLEEQDFFAFDTETDGVDPLKAGLVGMSFAVKENEAWYVPVPATREEADKVLAHFSPALQNPKSLKIGQNIKFDILVVRKYGIRVAGPLFDTMIAHYLLNPELRHGMDYLAETYLKYKTHRRTDRAERKKATYHARCPGCPGSRICRRGCRHHTQAEKLFCSLPGERRARISFLRYRDAFNICIGRNGVYGSHTRHRRLETIVRGIDSRTEKVGKGDLRTGRNEIQYQLGPPGRRSSFRPSQDRRESEKDEDR